MPPHVDEQLLLKNISEGSWESYTSLFNIYLDKLSQYIYPFVNQSREDTEEIIQEVFLKIWERREHLSSIRTFDQYLFRMAKNKLIDLLAKRRSIKDLHKKYAASRQASHCEPEQDLIYAEYQETAKKAIEELSPKLRTVFFMSTRDELSLDEIASRLRLPKETVKKRLYLAGAFIRNYLRIKAEWLGFLTICYLLY
ncbi:MAG: sigma-70 family RNA polymerase sigma factor [Chitinophagaceae bacterium]|nr:sigma-70 family RNA polymerase sigma factor [Chitinophagaceae bacterium]